MNSGSRRSLAAALVSLGVLVLCDGRAKAMQFELDQIAPTEIIMVGRGPIVHGDYDRFTRALATVSQTGHPLVALALDSPGGSVMEARQLVAIIHDRHMTVVLPHNTQCASACFLLIAASPRRLAATDALIGVHSASVNGAETDTSMAVTTLMARDAHDLGVPPAIVGKMVETAPGRVEWLGPADLASMNVTMFDGDLATALHQAPAGTATALALATPRIQSDPPPSPAGQPLSAAAGRADRRSWDNWVAGLRGAYKEGAVFAQSRIPETRPGDCYGPNDLNRGDFTLGCTSAQQRLSPIFAKIKADPDYASGWSAQDQQVAASEPYELEYQGVYFCASQVARLTVKIFPGTDEPRRRVLIAFGPHSISPDVAPGSFMAEGLLDTVGGAITVAPVKWISRPPNVAWFGINGGSDDGGKTFSGRVTDSATCTRFTLAANLVGQHFCEGARGKRHCHQSHHLAQRHHRGLAALLEL